MEDQLDENGRCLHYGFEFGQFREYNGLADFIWRRGASRADCGEARGEKVYGDAMTTATVQPFALPSLPSIGGIGSSIVSFFTGGGWVLYAIIFAAGLGAGGYATHLWYAPKLADEKTATAHAQAATAAAEKATSDLAAASQKAVADALRQVSDENIKAAAQSKKDASTIAQLQGQLAQEQIAHVRISAQLSAELERAKANGNKLSAPVLAYLDELRNYAPGLAAPTGGAAPPGR